MVAAGVNLVVYNAPNGGWSTLGVYAGLAIIVVAIAGLIGGVGVLVGRSYGRIIGVLFSLLIAFEAFVIAARGEDFFAGVDIPDGRTFGLVAFVLCAYSVIVLLARWRVPTTA